MTVPMVQAAAGLPKARKRDKIAALAVLPFAIVLSKQKPVYTEKVFTLLRRLNPSLPNVQRATLLIAAFRWAGRLYPGRIACLETAIGAALLGALCRSMPRYCVGAKFNPLQHHAWLEALQEGVPVPVAEPEALVHWPYKHAFYI